MKSSRIPAFYRMTVAGAAAEARGGARPFARRSVRCSEAADALPLDVADIMVENAVGTFAAAVRRRAQLP